MTLSQKERVAPRMHRHLQICVLEVYSNHPVVLTYSFQDSLRCLHLEGSGHDVPVESGEVYDRPEAPGGLGDHKDPAVETRSRGSVLHRSLGQQGQDLSPQGNASLGKGGIRRKVLWNT